MENRRRFSLVLALVLLLGVLPRGAAPVHAEDSRTFPETGKTAKGRFLTYWDNHGALASLHRGY